MATVGGVVAAVLLVVVICLAATIWYVCKLRRQQRNTKGMHRVILTICYICYSQYTNQAPQVHIQFKLFCFSHDAVHVRKFDYSRLSNATRSFSANERVGAGSFGAVYRGTMVLEGKEEVVAIKKIIEATSERSKKEFDNEIRIMSPLSHRNIIKLLGWCNERNNLLLVYEMMEKGNLEDQLYPNNGATDSELYRVTVPGTALLLDWPKKYTSEYGTSLIKYTYDM